MFTVSSITVMATDVTGPEYILSTFGDVFSLYYIKFLVYLYVYIYNIFIIAAFLAICIWQVEYG